MKHAFQRSFSINKRVLEIERERNTFIENVGKFYYIVLNSIKNAPFVVLYLPLQNQMNYANSFLPQVSGTSALSLN
jgi:hypothetical protein